MSKSIAYGSKEEFPETTLITTEVLWNTEQNLPGHQSSPHYD